jgi:hypothetical protein
VDSGRFPNSLMKRTTEPALQPSSRYAEFVLFFPAGRADHGCERLVTGTEAEHNFARPGYLTLG